jgi:methylated-DNA-[protein]-cysteine S-methyltransferase
MEMDHVYYSFLELPLLKKVFVASTEKGVCSIDFHTSEREFRRYLKKRFSSKIIKKPGANQKVLSQLKNYAEGRLKDFDCSLDLGGTPFQRKVWEELMKIPYGETRSYRDVARAIGHPKAFRAVGNANGSNPVPVIVPCHRVIESNGGLGGYGQGIDVKKKLLDFEKAHAI